ncbi:MAG: hypothetical protein HZA25_02390 [Candidatus Niyogibacteria bacterium]|nr:hypothetical protein [Candidatus Niyogibacteria bacterium]
MNIIDKIEKLQQRPEAERKKIFTVTLALSMVVVIGIWLSLLGHNLRSLGAEKAADSPAPTALVWESVNGALADLKQGITTGVENIK